MNEGASTHEGLVKRVSLRFRLTLWMLLIFLVVQLSLALVFELYQSRSINNYVNQRAADRIEQLARLVVGSIPENGPSDSELRSQASNQGLTPSDQFILDVVDENGQVLASTHRPGITLPLDALATATRSGRTSFSAGPPDRLNTALARITIVPATTTDGHRYFVVAAMNDEQAQELLGLMSRVILLSIPIGLIATAVSAYIIAGIAVRPLSDIRAAASLLSPESISKHLPASPASEEVAAVQRELELARQRIEIGFMAQERFMSNVSHELKTPIATLLTEAQVLKADKASTEVREFVRSVTEELDKLGRTVDSFLLLTRVRHGKALVPAAETCYVRDVLVDSYASCISTATQYGVRVDLQIPENEHANAAVVGNCDLLRIIFDNIIRNAIRFSPEKSVIMVRAWVSESEVHISVRDRGPGIPPALLPRVFDRFAQSTDEERRGRGHGLGLEIALGIAELHAGTIHVRNCDDGGCEFTIKLPLADGSCDHCKHPNEQVPPDADSPAA